MDSRAQSSVEFQPSTQSKAPAYGEGFFVGGRPAGLRIRPRAPGRFLRPASVLAAWRISLWSMGWLQCGQFMRAFLVSDRKPLWKQEYTIPSFYILQSQCPALVETTNSADRGTS
jgi:hypothetical protein